ncbi:MAG: hypothetical protein U1E66_08105 [Rhodospirillales bacterium]
MTFDVGELAAKLHRVEHIPNGVRAECPVHGGHSLEVSTGKDGRAVWHCFGCGEGNQQRVTDAIFALMGRKPNGAGTNGERHPLAYSGHNPIRVHHYRDAAGEVRFANAKYGDSVGWRPWTKDATGWRLGGQAPAPYRVTHLAASTSPVVYLFEGEKDADTAAELGLNASSFKGWRREWNHYLSRFETVVVIGDGDTAGDMQMNGFDPGREVQRFSTAEIAHRLGVKGKDISELHAAVGSERLRQAIAELVGPLVDGDAADTDADGEAVDDRTAAPLYLPEEFWQSRTWLHQFRAWAHGRGFSADASFAVVLTRTAALLPSTAVLDTGILSRRHPNIYACVVGAPGAGKTQSVAAGRECVAPQPGMALVEASPGSGEGIEGAMCTYSKETGWRQTSWNVWLSMDEGRSLETLSQRSGATLAEKLRSAWSGVALSTSLATGTRTAKDYALGFVLCAQPIALAGLMSEADLGGPARFLFVRANDPTRPRHAPSAVMPATGDWRPTGPLTLAPNVRAIVEDDHYRATTTGDERDALAAHRNLLRARLAVLIAGLTERRDEANIDDWGLAGVLMEISDNVRDAVLADIEATKAEAAGERVALHVAMVHAGKAAMDGPNPIPRVAAVLWRRCKKLGRMARWQANQAIKKNDRIYLDAALAHAAAAGWIEPEGEAWKPGPQPAV